MHLSDAKLRSVSRLTRPLLSAHVPLVTPACKRLLKWAAQGLHPGQSQLICEYLGGKIHIDLFSSIEYDVLFRGGQELSHLRLYGQLLRPGDVCLDVGANVGVHSLVMARA